MTSRRLRVFYVIGWRWECWLGRRSHALTPCTYGSRRFRTAGDAADSARAHARLLHPGATR